MTSRYLAAAAIATALAGAGAGCGNSGSESANKYVDQVNKVQEQFASAAKTFSSAPTSSLAQGLGQFKSVEAALKDSIAKFQAIKPPSNVASLHAQLVSQFQRFDAALGAEVAALSSNNSSKITAASGKLASDSSQIAADQSKTIDAINKKLHG